MFYCHSPTRRRPVFTALRVITDLNKRCNLSECERVLPCAQHQLPTARHSCSPSIISCPRQVEWDDCHCGELVKYKMLHLFMKWKFEWPEKALAVSAASQPALGWALSCHLQGCPIRELLQGLQGLHAGSCPVGLEGREEGTRIQVLGGT